MPTAIVGDQVVGLGRTPGAGGVDPCGREVGQRRLDDPPDLLDTVGPGEQTLVAVQGTVEQAGMGVLAWSVGALVVS